jgi:hypothetical protein
MRASLVVGGLMSLVVVAGAATCGKEPIMADQHTPSTGASPAAPATQGGLELSASASGTTLHVVLRNVGQAPLRLFGAVSGPDRKHYDYLRAELVASSGRRTLRFTGARNASDLGLVELPPGREVAYDIDLASWATQPINGGQPLASGEHAVTVIYELSQSGVWNGRLSVGPVAVRAP